MSNIDKQALREAAELFNSEEDDHWWDEEQLTHEDGLGLNEADGKFIATANPATVLALLDELEAKDKLIAELEFKLEAADKLQDSAFRHGLQHGFSYGQTDNQAGFEQAIQAYGQQWKGE